MGPYYVESVFHFDTTLILHKIIDIELQDALQLRKVTIYVQEFARSLVSISKTLIASLNW